MGNSFIPRIGGDIPLKKKPQQSRQDYSFMPGAVNDLLNFTGNTIRTMGDDKIAGLQSQMEGQMRQDYAPPQMTQTPGKASLAAAGMTLLLNMLDTQHKAGQGFAEGFMQAEKAKRDAEYQNAQAKLEEKKRKDATELQITFQRLQQEQKQKDDRMKALQEAIKARRDLAVKESEDERAQKNAIELIQARGAVSGNSAEEITKRMLLDKMLNPSTDEKDKLNAFNELNGIRVRNGEPTLNPEDYNIGKSYRQANTEARTQTENELRPGKKAKLDAEVKRILSGIETDVLKRQQLEQKIKAFPDEFQARMAEIASRNWKREQDALKSGSTAAIKSKDMRKDLEQEDRILTKSLDDLEKRIHEAIGDNVANGGRSADLHSMLSRQATWTARQKVVKDALASLTDDMVKGKSSDGFRPVPNSKVGLKFGG